MMAMERRRPAAVPVQNQRSEIEMKRLAILSDEGLLHDSQKAVLLWARRRAR
jgi:hypothetical protein